MLERALQLASHITNPITASAFAVAILGSVLYLVVKAKSKPVVWLLATGLIVVGLAPLASYTFLASRGIYRISVIVLGPDNQPVTNADLSTSVGVATMKTASGWEIEIPPQTKPAGGKVIIYARSTNAFLTGWSALTLEKEYYPSVEIHLTKPRTVTIRGQVLDENQRAVSDADVSLPDCSQSTTTDSNGLFALDSCAFQGQMVKIRAEKGKLSDSITVPAGDTVEVVLRKDLSRVR